MSTTSTPAGPSLVDLSREAALRIALAARAIPEVTVAGLLEVLHQRLGPPLDVEKLGRITVTDIKTGFASLDGEEDGEDVRDGGVEPYKEAVRILWGEIEDAVSGIPDCHPLAPGEMESSIRVAIASNSGELLDGHFGSCLRFLIYQMSETEIRLIDVRSALETDLSDDKNLARAQLVEDCQILMVVSVGGPAAAKVVKLGVYPMKKIEGGEARAALAELQAVFKKPPPWLAKVLGAKAGMRVLNYDAESDDD